jgi:dihydroorotase-like cyclic amidohydrolase
VLLKGGRVVDATGERMADVLVAGGRIVSVGLDLDVPAGATVLDAAGCVVAPGLVDLHTRIDEIVDVSDDGVDVGEKRLSGR